MKMLELGERNAFAKSDIGSQAAWKGFSSQTLYIASRIVNDTDDCEFFPEDVEDLLIKQKGAIIEAVQIKNISADLTFSSLASTKSSKGGEGFFRRVCALRKLGSPQMRIKVVHFGALGSELQMFVNGDDHAREALLRKLTTSHELVDEDAKWLLSSLVFEEINMTQLHVEIDKQILEYGPVMAAPDLAKALLIQYVSDLSNLRGHTTLQGWQEQIYIIGKSLAAMDGYFREYDKSLVRLCDLCSSQNPDRLHKEFQQGIAVHPDHIRNNFDFSRDAWIQKIVKAMEKNAFVIVKGVSGQGKTALCYRYLLDHYPEQLVFCVRSIASVGQAENLVAALNGIVRHTRNIIVYIDVNTSELKWIYLLQELRARGLSVPVLVSIRDEDYNMTPVNTSISFELVELELSKGEAQIIYESYTTNAPHQYFRSFNEAWARFSESGPLIEFVYLLTNNQTLKQRLDGQIAALLHERIPDSWLNLLQIVCFAGRTGCSIELSALKHEAKCDNIHSAINRLSDEYLIRCSDDGWYVEALHPQRAQILCDVLKKRVGENHVALMLASLKCLDSRYAQMFLMDYFSMHAYSPDLVLEIATIGSKDWVSFGSVIKTMLWLDVKRYVDENHAIIKNIVEERGKGWLVFMPLDISGMIQPGDTILENIGQALPNTETQDRASIARQIKDSLTSLQIDYQATDLFIRHCEPPGCLPISDNEWSSFGYSLFWLAKRTHKVEASFSHEVISKNMLYGDIRSRADAIRGLYEQNGSDEYYRTAVTVLLKRLYTDFRIIDFMVCEDEVKCSFVPPILDDTQAPDGTTNLNHYWRIRLLDILQQMYSDKQHIEIVLVGVDLFRDLGIEAIDDRIRIHKSNRYDSWITEVNGWLSSRVNSYFRPDCWQDYVARVDATREAWNDLVIDLIASVDNVYKNHVLDRRRWDKVVEGANKLKRICFSDMLLPKSVVDPYCLYSEGMRAQPDQLLLQEQLKPITHMLSYVEYDNFQGSLSEVYRQLDNFLAQFPQLLMPRVEKSELTDDVKYRLPLFNLLGSSKALLTLQKEYKRLFDGYGTLDEKFSRAELENFLTLLNMCDYICRNPVRGYYIAYDAKERYKNSGKKTDQALEDAATSMDGKLLSIDGATYVLVSLDPFSGRTLEDYYVDCVLNLRRSLEPAQAFGSERWYLETRYQKLVFVSVYEGIPFSSGLLLPVYKILDTNEDEIASILFPDELPDSFYCALGLQCKELRQWEMGIGYLSFLGMLIRQYNNVVSGIRTETVCKIGVTKYLNTFLSQVSETIDSFTDVVAAPLSVLTENPNELTSELADLLQELFSYLLQVIPGKMTSGENIEDPFETHINAISALMSLLKPCVSAP